jgi:hypothetical protein
MGHRDVARSNNWAHSERNVIIIQKCPEKENDDVIDKVLTCDEKSIVKKFCIV